MPKLHILPIAALPMSRIEARDVTLSVVTDRQWGMLTPARIVPRKLSASSSLAVGGTVVSRYGWLVSVVSERIFKDVELTFRWEVDSAHYRGGCDHRIIIRLLPSANLHDPVWSMDGPSEMEKGGLRSALSAPVSVFASDGRTHVSESVAADRSRIVSHCRDGRIMIQQTLDIAPVQMASIA